MELRRSDCERCQSAHSVEHGVCQVCLAEQTSPAVRVGTSIARAVLRRQLDTRAKLAG